MAFKKAQPGNWEAVKQIYEEGIASGNETFQQQAPGWEVSIPAYSFGKMLSSMNENVKE
jgi:hypothetical protein